MKTIYRYSLPITDRPMVFMPIGAEVLPCPPGIRNTDSEIEFWAVVDSDARLQWRDFRVVGTGNPMPDDAVGSSARWSLPVVCSCGTCLRR